jgi:hypothetical protein
MFRFILKKTFLIQLIITFLWVANTNSLSSIFFRVHMFNDGNIDLKYKSSVSYGEFFDANSNDTDSRIAAPSGILKSKTSVYIGSSGAKFWLSGTEGKIDLSYPHYTGNLLTWKELVTLNYDLPFRKKENTAKVTPKIQHGLRYELSPTMSKGKILETQFRVMYSSPIDELDKHPSFGIKSTDLPLDVIGMKEKKKKRN